MPVYAGVKIKDGEILEADLTVDASGKHSLASKWLQQLGHEPPPEIAGESGLQYTYRLYEMPDDPERNWSIAVCIDHPEYNRTAVMVPIETNKWQVRQLSIALCIAPLKYNRTADDARWNT